MVLVDQYLFQILCHIFVANQSSLVGGCVQPNTRSMYSSLGHRHGVSYLCQVVTASETLCECLLQCRQILTNNKVCYFHRMSVCCNCTFCNLFNIPAASTNRNIGLRQDPCAMLGSGFGRLAPYLEPRL